MWVWSDELVDRVPGDDMTGLERVPLIAYAVGSDADLDELAAALVVDMGAVGVAVEPADSGAADR